MEWGSEKVIREELSVQQRAGVGTSWMVAYSSEPGVREEKLSEKGDMFRW